MAPGKSKGPGRKKAAKGSKQTKAPSIRRRLAVLFAAVLAISMCIYAYENRAGFKGFIHSKRFQPVIDRIEQAVGDLFLETWEAEIFFGDEYSDMLVTEYRKITSAGAPERKAAALVLALIDGPKAKGVRTTPEQTMLRSAVMKKNGLLEVDFNGALVKSHPGGSSSELMTVFSIVNTLAVNIDEVESVKILVEGSTIETIAGHIDCREPFSPNLNIVK